jgi:putative transcriptional regulator
MSADGEDKKNFMAGRILLAMPGMADPRFHRAVIFVCAHDSNGAMGIVVNHRLPGLELHELMRQLQINPVITDANTGAGQPVMSGGPVETARGFVLHSPDFRQSDTIRINDSFSVTATVDALKAIATGKGPNAMLFALGYAGWGAGQLDKELQANAWLVADADPELIFTAIPDLKWETAIRKMGIEPGMLSDVAGHA